MQLEPEGHLLAESLPPWGASVFHLLRPSTDWRRPTLTVEGRLLYSTDEMFISCQKYLHSDTHTRLTKYRGVAKLTHKINHNSY